MNLKLEILFLTIAIICVAGIIVFSCINMPGRELAMCIFGLVLVLTALCYMWLYNRESKKRK
ncbi:MAG: hypothetical protein J1E16_05045 [Muribaculaceae bacterium]|nr:hypothetical protein [Muribaculaceae bacterium]